jgi:hypothetical protein
MRTSLLCAAANAAIYNITTGGFRRETHRAVPPMSRFNLGRPADFTHQCDLITSIGVPSHSQAQ